MLGQVTKRDLRHIDFASWIVTEGIEAYGGHVSPDLEEGPNRHLYVSGVVKTKKPSRIAEILNRRVEKVDGQASLPPVPIDARTRRIKDTIRGLTRRRRIRQTLVSGALASTVVAGITSGLAYLSDTHPDTTVQVNNASQPSDVEAQPSSDARPSPSSISYLSSAEHGAAIISTAGLGLGGIVAWSAWMITGDEVERKRAKTVAKRLVAKLPVIDA